MMESKSEHGAAEIVLQNAKTKIPTVAQAKRLAYLWGGEKTVTYRQKQNPTIDVLVREGWLEPTGDVFTYPDGSPGGIYVVSKDGVAVLGAYMASQRQD